MSNWMDETISENKLAQRFSALHPNYPIRHGVPAMDRCKCGGVRHWHAMVPYGCDDCGCTEFVLDEDWRAPEREPLGGACPTNHGARTGNYEQNRYRTKFCPDCGAPLDDPTPANLSD